MAFSTGLMGQFHIATTAPIWGPNKGSWRDRSSAPSSSPSPPLTSSPTSSSSESWRGRSSSSTSAGSASSEGSKTSSSNWRTGAPLARNSPKGLPRFDDLHLGQVVYLPDESAIPGDSKIRSCVRPGSAPWNHPAIVTGKWVKNGEQYVHLRHTTSFDGRALEQGRPNPSHWQYFRLAQNQVDNKPPGGTQLLSMAPSSGTFAKRTYINFGMVSRYSIEYRHLEAYRPAPMLRFDNKSTKAIITMCREATKRDARKLWTMPTATDGIHA